MSATVEWDIPFTLATVQGNLPINFKDSSTGGYYMLNHAQCDSGRDPRVARDDIPQESGDIMHPHYTSGYWMQLGIELWETIGDGGKPALYDLKVSMWDHLMRHLNSLIGDNPLVESNGRVYWTPRTISGIDRMLNGVRLIELPKPVQDIDGMVSAQFKVLSPFPYVWDAPETVTNITAGGTVNNTGSAPFYPVLKVYGPTNYFTITNQSVVDQNGDPLELVYDATFPGAQSLGMGDYAEISLFHNTVYLNGNQDNLKPGIDVANSDFWSLYPGNNVITVSGGYTGNLIQMLWQPAYA